MKIVARKQELLEALKIANRAVARHAFWPVLSHVKLEVVGEGQLELSATDLETRIDHRLAVRVAEPGAMTVPARLFTDLIGALPDRDMVLTQDGDALEVACGSHVAHVKGFNADEFPTPPTFQGEPSAKIPAGLLGSMLDKALIAVADDESRPILTGVYVMLEGEGLLLAAADGFRLSVCKAHLDGPAREEPIAAIVPGPALESLAQLLGDDDVHLSLSGNQALFRLPDADLACQLIEGRFPDYNRIIPESHKTRTVVNTGALLRACRTANIFARAEMEIVKLSIGTQRIVMSASSAEHGDTEVEVDAEGEGPPLDIAFNVGFLMDALSAVGTERVSIETTMASSPATIKPLGPDDFVHVLMPMHLTN